MSTRSLLKKKEFSLGQKMLEMVKDLFPHNRSLMGPDIRDSFNYFIKENPEFTPIKFKSGTKVFDWEVPEEWIIRDAYIAHESGKKFAEFTKNNLHLVGYSAAANLVLSKERLIEKIHTLPDYPSAIPYITSYYKRDWGFCLSQDELSTMPKGNYNVLIDSEHREGELWVIEAVIPGKSNKEVFFSSYLCHPSMANDNLSGPVLLNEIVNFVKRINNREYTYRFVILPETIGSISYLSRRLDTLKSNMICGFNLCCIGDENSYSHIYSRVPNNLADLALSAGLIDLDNVIEYNFLERGSDERQYCAPGIDLPVCGFCRSKYAQYPEYHTSKDDLNLVTAKGLEDSFKVMRNIIEAFELGIYPSIKVLGEPQLGKRDLYPNVSKLYKGNKHPAELRMNIIAYCDSLHNIFEISKKVNVNLSRVINEIKILAKNDLIELSQEKGKAP